ncbi:Core-2/I-Branching enzyme, partial [Teladorsagia circumcincta]
SYDFIEDELAASYHPQNVFCYSVDAKALDLFNSRIQILSKCFPNVLVTQARFSVTGSGRYQNHAFYECLKILSNIPGWEHVIMMQNYDMMIKSVYETASILQALDGTNDIGATECDPNRNGDVINKIERNAKEDLWFSANLLITHYCRLAGEYS